MDLKALARVGRTSMADHLNLDLVGHLERSDSDSDPLSLLITLRDGQPDGGAVIVCKDGAVLADLLAWAMERGYLTDGRGVASPEPVVWSHAAVEQD